MSSLVFKNVNKTYHNGVHAVRDFSLDIKEHEFIVVLGKSGCGKSTLLRLVSGLEMIDDGEIWMGEELINDVDPTKRDVAMVFQNYALYPQMSAYQNLAIPLKTKRIRGQVFDKNGNPVLSPNYVKIDEIKNKIYQLPKGKESKELKQQYKQQIKDLKANPSEPTYEWTSYTHEEIDKKVKEVAELLDITPFLNQKASSLSGGQKQRVALGKAMVRGPKVFLMDEPLSNLDAKLRNQAQIEIQKIHNKSKAITIYVTHEQSEAMNLADRVVVMKDGSVQQVGTPNDVFNNPNNLFVASFIGTPPMNLIDATFESGNLTIEDNTFQIKKILKCGDVVIGIRPDKLSYNPIKDGIKIPVICDYCELLGHDYYGYAFLGNQRICVKLPNKVKIEPEQQFDIYFNLESLFFFGKESGERIY